MKSRWKFKCLVYVIYDVFLQSVGIDKGDIPDLAKAPSSLLEALEEHLKSLEGQKKAKSEKYE